MSGLGIVRGKLSGWELSTGKLSGSQYLYPSTNGCTHKDLTGVVFQGCFFGSRGGGEGDCPVMDIILSEWDQGMDKELPKGALTMFIPFTVFLRTRLY